jgi:hypothetical protein
MIFLCFMWICPSTTPQFGLAKIKEQIQDLISRLAKLLQMSVYSVDMSFAFMLFATIVRYFRHSHWILSVLESINNLQISEGMERMCMPLACIYAFFSFSSDEKWKIYCWPLTSSVISVLNYFLKLCQVLPRYLRIFSQDHSHC